VGAAFSRDLANLTLSTNFLIFELTISTTFTPSTVSTIYCLPLTAYRLPLTAHRLPLTIYDFDQSRNLKLGLCVFIPMIHEISGL
jgi:hypothetical protein